MLLHLLSTKKRNKERYNIAERSRIMFVMVLCVCLSFLWLHVVCLCCVVDRCMALLSLSLRMCQTSLGTQSTNHFIYTHHIRGGAAASSSAIATATTAGATASATASAATMLACCATASAGLWC